MRQTWKVARREFRSYFDHATAYVLLVAFLGLGFFLSFRSLFAQGLATLRPLFDLLPWLFVVFVPALTMRTLAEERRTGTLDWLMAQPVDELEVVLGKFLGDWLFALVALAGTLPMALGVLLVSTADPGIMLAQYAGAAMLTAQMVAIGVFASAATQNQITAFILGVAITFVLVLAGLPFTLQGLPTALAEPVGRLSLLTHFDAVARGVVDLRDVVYFVSAAALFLALAYFLVTRRRLSAERGLYDRLRLGTAALAVGTVVLNLLGGHIHGRLDLTRNDLFTLSEGTRQVVGRLDDVVRVQFFVSRELPPEVMVTRRDVEDLLGDYERVSGGNVEVEVLHPGSGDGVAEEARSLGIREIQFNVLRGDEYQVKQGWMGLSVLHAGEHETIPVIRNTSDLEYRITSAIASLAAEERSRVAFLQGFGARTGSAFPELVEMLRERYEVTARSIGGDSVPELSPDSLEVVILAGPRDSLSTAARRAFRAYLDAGGAALVLADPVEINPRMPVATPVRAALGSLLGDRGVDPAERMVYDLRSNERISAGMGDGPPVIRSYPLWPVALPVGDHMITRELQAVSLGWAAPLAIRDTSRATPLLATSPYAGTTAPSGSITPDLQLATAPDSLSRRVVAAAGRGERGRVVVVGDVTFLESNFARSNPQNVAFAANAVDWLAQREALIAIRSKDRTPPPLVFESSAVRHLLKWGNLIGVPLLFALYGTGRILRRRRLAARGWEGEEVAT